MDAAQKKKFQDFVDAITGGEGVDDLFGDAIFSKHDESPAAQMARCIGLIKAAKDAYAKVLARQQDAK